MTTCLHIIRATGFRDFVADCKPFEVHPCVRCGQMPEKLEWITCRACQLAPVGKQIGLIKGAAKDAEKRGADRAARGRANAIRGR